nr:HesB/YadR/YfhF family protein [Indiicoccus explosivorum]
MDIVVSKKALDWFKEEMEAEPGDHIRFFARYGGSSKLHEGFSLGVTKDTPDEAAAERTVDGLLFYVEERDFWYFDGHDLHVGLNEATGELEYDYKKA